MTTLNDQLAESPALDALAASLAKAQGQFPDIQKNRTVEFTGRKYHYATIDAVINAIRKPLSDNGLSFVQLADDKAVTLILLHSSGQQLRSSPMPIRAGGGTSQAFGSALTYAKRYQLCAFFGVAADEDDDGNAADGNQAQPKAKQQAKPPEKPRERVNTNTGEVIQEDNPLADNEAFKHQLAQAYSERGAIVSMSDQVTRTVLEKKKVKTLDEYPVKDRATFIDSIKGGKLDHLLKMKRGSEIQQPTKAA